MPVLKPEKEQAGTAQLPTPAVPHPGDPNFTGPVVTPTSVIAPGLKGSARLQAEIDQRKALFSNGMWGHDFNQWALSLKDDPGDPDYTQAVQWLRTNATRAEQGEVSRRKATGSYDFTVPGNTPFDQGTVASNQSAGGPEGQPKPTPLGPPAGTSPGTSSLASVPAVTQADIDDRELKKRTYATSKSGDTLTEFKGTPVSQGSLGTPSGEDAALAQFMSRNGKVLTGSQSSYAKTSGAFVYVGSRTLRDGSTEETYMYVQDAKNALVALGSQRLADYQTTLGLPVTGYPDKQLRAMWDFAVEEAASSAAADVKNTVQEIFDSMINANAGKLGGGGGGGGSGAAPLDSYDYYRAMMQVLGDVSGVKA